MSAELAVRHDWTLQKIRAIHDLPLFELLDRARAVHRAIHQQDEGAALHAAQRQDRRLPRGLRLLPAVERTTRPAVGAEKMLDVDEVLARRRARKEPARRASAWAPPGAR